MASGANALFGELSKAWWYRLGSRSPPEDGVHTAGDKVDRGEPAATSWASRSPKRSTRCTSTAAWTRRSTSRASARWWPSTAARRQRVSWTTPSPRWSWRTTSVCRCAYMARFLRWPWTKPAAFCATSARTEWRRPSAPPRRGLPLAGHTDAAGTTALTLSVGVASPRIARTLLDAGADETKASRSTILGPTGVGPFTPLEVVVRNPADKKFQGTPATEDQLYRVEAILRLLLRVDAVRAASWLWPTNGTLSARVEGGDAEGKAVPIVRREPGVRRALRALLASIFRSRGSLEFRAAASGQR